MKQIHSAGHHKARSKGDADWEDFGAPKASASKGRTMAFQESRFGVFFYITARISMYWLSFLHGGRGNRMAVIGSFYLLVKENNREKLSHDADRHKSSSKSILCSSRGGFFLDVGMWD